MIPVEGEGAQYWPRWRGPSGQGVVDDVGYPDRWSDTENVMWAHHRPGDAATRRRLSGGTTCS